MIYNSSPVIVKLHISEYKQKKEYLYLVYRIDSANNVFVIFWQTISSILF